MEGDRNLEPGGRPRRSLSGRPIRLPTILVVLGLAVSGCGDDEKGPVGPGDPIPPPLTSPQNVLQNLLLAYVARDSVQTALVYDDAYQGASVDPSGIVGNFNFAKADEVSHVGGLRRNPNIAVVAVDFGSPSSWTRMGPDPADPPDWAQIQINTATIQVEEFAGSTHQVQNQAMIYKFKPTVAAPGDTTWKIVEWTEIVTNPPGPG